MFSWLYLQAIRPLGTLATGDPLVLYEPQPKLPLPSRSPVFMSALASLRNPALERGSIGCTQDHQGGVVLLDVLLQAGEGVASTGRHSFNSRGGTPLAPYFISHL